MSDNAITNKKLYQARACYKNGDFNEADTICQSILSDEPAQIDAMHIRGLIAFQRGDIGTSISLITSVVEVKPDNAYYCCDLGRVYLANDNLDRAESCFTTALKLKPDFILAMQLLGDLCRKLGRIDESIVYYKNVVNHQPENFAVIFALAKLYYLQGNMEDALQHSASLVEAHPENADCLNMHGVIYHAARELETASALYQKAVQLNPSMIDGQNNLGSVLQQMDRQKEAAIHYACALKLQPDQEVWSLRIDMLCPTVAVSNKEIDEYRESQMKKLDGYISSEFKASPQELVLSGIFPPYALMYQGRNDKEVRERYAKVFQRSFPNYPRGEATGKRKVAFVVTRGHEELFMKSMQGVIQHIDSQKFELSIVCPAESASWIYAGIGKPSLNMISILDSIDELANLLEISMFDILYYWEIATDALNYFLPYFRLAPIQCTSWGIQVTSGIPNVDYYLSSSLVEVPEADDHYTEKLLLADTLLTYQYRKTLSADHKKREDFNVDDDKTLYLFPQQIGKFHPDFDKVVSEILVRDPDGILVILKGRWGYSAEDLRMRLKSVLGDEFCRVIFLARMNHDDYLSLVAAADVLLDPPYYGGVNSTYDGISLNVPIVTCESPHHIARYTAACYRKIGVTDCIAKDLADYVDIAVRLGTDVEYRNTYCERIARVDNVLFEDMDAVRAHERLFEYMIAQLG